MYHFTTKYKSVNVQTIFEKQNKKNNNKQNCDAA